MLMHEAFWHFAAPGLGLLLLLVVMVWLLRRRKAAAHKPFAYPEVANVPLSAAHSYRADTVGNDASARPWERSSFGPATPQPSDFDTADFLQTAKTNFVYLQAAWDRADIASLRAMMTGAMRDEIQGQLAEREAQGGANTNRTEILALEARLLGLEQTGNDYMASVEFSGMLREDPSAGPAPFREVWSMTKPVKGGSGWLVAGVQALR